MILMGISDEAGALMETQIRATRELGWNNIEARAVEVPGFGKGNIRVSTTPPTNPPMR